MSNKQTWSPIPRSTSVSITATLALAFILAVATQPNYAGDIAQSPLYLTTSVPPVVMLSMSNDHQLFMKAYSDYSDVTGDGIVDITYADTFDYYGYFNTKRCYDYSAGRFVPASPATGANEHHCSGSYWSGNFLNWATMTRMDIVRKVIYGGMRSVDTTTETELKRANLPNDIHAFSRIFADSAGNSLYTPFSQSPITLCNVSWATTGYSHTTNPEPIIRVADGAFPLWAANEREQCAWGSGNAPPSSAQIGVEYTTRVQVCDSDVGLEENCRAYSDDAGTVTYKPAGILQQYGEDEEQPIRFGLLTGSYGKKAKGGILRKEATQATDNATSGYDELDRQTGIFTGNNGIVKALDTLRVVGRNYSTDKYDGLDSWSCTDNWDLLKSEFLEVDERCPSWGNPVAEFYLETLRYLAGGGGTPPDPASPSAEFDSDDTPVLPLLPKVSTWGDPIHSDQYCAKSHVVLISTASNSFDSDQLSMASDIGIGNLDSLVDDIGTQEGISGNSYFVGNEFICSAETVGALSDLRGICPGMPSLEGSYAVAGLAYHANISDLRAPTNIEQHIQTFAIALARDIPEFNASVNGQNISFMPICTGDNDDTWPSDKACSLVDVVIREQNLDADGGVLSARYRVVWEVSSWGEDYDQDAVTQYEFCVGRECDSFVTQCHDCGGETCGGSRDYVIEPTSGKISYIDGVAGVADNELLMCQSRLAQSSGTTLFAGYSISGSNADQSYNREIERSGNYSLVSDPTSTAGTVATPRRFTANTGSPPAGTLPSPLWLAAKYGGFQDLNDNDQPDLQNEWDVDRDGEPDNYFLADNPGLLGPRLARFLDTALQESSAASVAANSLSAETESYIYQARFNSADWSGDLIKIPIGRLADPGAGGSFGGEAVWSAQAQLDDQDWDTQRVIISATGPTDAVAFRWANDALNSGDDGDPNIGDLLNYSVTGTKDDPDHELGGERLNFIRGDNTNAGIGNGREWRDRQHLLGDLIHSAPTYVAEPFLNYPDDLETGTNRAYSTFKSTYNARDGVVYVGGNDGMLHGFDDETGNEIIGYVPRALYPTLRYLTDPQYDDPASEKHRYSVDSSPNLKDAYIDDAWRTVLVNGLGAGGRGIFALDITDPSSFSEDNADNILLWDISAAENSDLGLVADSGFEDLGYTFSEPTIVRLPDQDDNTSGQWIALFGNGYPAGVDLDSGTGTGHAVLYFVDLATGDLLQSLFIDDSSIDNGLSSAAAVDLNRDNRIDLIYVGDLHGNLWRIEPAASGTDWQVSEFGTGSPTPLFTAQVTIDSEVIVQPITVLPEVARHPNGGQIVLFGTGQYYEKGDTDNDEPQSFYGIWDYYDAFTSAGSFLTITRAALQEQSIIQEDIITIQDGDNSSLLAVRTLSDNDVDWWSPSYTTGKKGWYLDLVVNTRLQGERVVFNPRIEGGNVIFNSLIPLPNPCDFGGDSYIFVVDLLTGGRLTEDLFGVGLVTITLLNGDTVQVPVSAIKPSPPGDSTIAMPATNIGRVRGGGDEASCGKQLYAVSTSDGNITYLLTEAPTCSGRKSWTQLR